MTTLLNGAAYFAILCCVAGMMLCAVRMWHLHNDLHITRALRSDFRNTNGPGPEQGASPIGRLLLLLPTIGRCTAGWVY